MFMKSHIFTALLLLLTGSISAQTKFGIATYTTPAGWQLNQQAATVILNKSQAKGKSCHITIFATEKTAVNSEALFLKQLAVKAGNGSKYDKNLKAVKRSELNGNICYGAKGTAESEGKQVTAYFYSLTNNKQTFFVQLLSDDDACINDFKSFWASLMVDTGQEEAAPSNARAKRKAAPAAPAAPAPMM